MRVSIIENGSLIDTTLEDRGELVYRIREPNPYNGLEDADFRAEVCFLNRSAKTTFARRMGLPCIKFGIHISFSQRLSYLSHWPGG